MIGIDTIVWFVFIAIILVLVIAILWWLLNYCETQFPAPLAWKVIRVIFVVICAFIAIAVLLGLLGHPIIKI